MEKVVVQGLRHYCQQCTASWHTYLKGEETVVLGLPCKHGTLTSKTPATFELFGLQAKEYLAAEPQEYPSTPDQATYPSAAQLLQQLRDMISQSLLSQAQINQLLSDPEAFLRSICPAGAMEIGRTLAGEVMKAIVIGYCQSLLAKEAEGEKYDGPRLQRALLKAQTTGVEALEQLLEGPHATVAERIRIVEMLRE